MSRIYLSPPDVGTTERELLMAAFDSNWIAPLGPHVDAFEAEIAGRVGRAHAAALCSGTAGLHLALRLLGVGAGDKVIVQSLTFAATANAVMYLGAEPVFVDSNAEHWCMDADLLSEALTSLAKAGTPAKAVIPVDLYGQCPDYDRIVALCKEHGAAIIEDAAESLGSTWNGQPAGSFGDMAILSFNGNKIITTSGGGMLVSNSAEHIDRARYLATQARDPAPHYQHSTIGYNYRLSNLLAALGRGQLQHLDHKVDTRRGHREAYTTALAKLGVAMLQDRPGMRSNSWLSVGLVDASVAGIDREMIRLALAKVDIEARPVWKPMHQQPVFADAVVFGGACSDQIFRDGICLPSGSSLTPEQRGRVVSVIEGLAQS